MKKIPLTRGKFALVDDEDYNELSKHKWFASRRQNKYGDTWYAERQFRHPTLLNSKGRRKQIAVSMHRVVMNAPENKQVDHADGNPLNNQKRNLRFVTNQQNRWNQSRQATPDSPYKGVARYKTKSHLGWTLRIGFNGEVMYLGWFKRAETAAKAYDRLATALFGEFARLNFPEPNQNKSTKVE